MTEDYKPLTTHNGPNGFLQGGGELGALTRSYDWAGTPLGTPDEWPQSLRTTLGIVLHSAFPMFLFWGDDLLCFYNDAYRPSLGQNGKHPALGKPGRDVWPEIWSFIKPLIDQVLATGEPIWFEDQLVPIYRNGQLEDVYWTFSYSPAYGDDGQINGVLVTCTETTEKVANAKQQQEKTDLLLAVFDSSLSGISVLKAVRDEQGHIVDFEYQLANRVTEQLNNRQDLVGQRYSAVHSAYKQAGLFADFVTAVETGQPIERDLHYPGEGLNNWYATVTVKHDDGVVLSFRDITAEHTARQRIDASEARFRSLIAEAPVAMLIYTGPDMVMQEANEKMLEIFGRGNAVLGKPLLETVPELVGTPLPERYRQVLTTGETHYEYAERILLIKNGQPYWGYYDYIYKALRNSDNSIYGVICTAIDVTEQVLAQQRLEQSQQQLLALFEQSPVAIAIISEEDLTFQMANAFYGELTGRTPAQLVGKPMLEALPELRGQGFDGLLNDVFATGIPFIANEVAVNVVRNGQSETIYVDFTYQPQRKTDQTAEKAAILSVLVVCVDVTQQVRSRRQVETSEARLRSVITSAPFPIGVYVGQDMRIQLANQSILDVWGKGNDVVGKRYADVLPELANQEIFDQLDGVYQTGIPFHASNQRVDLVVDDALQPYYFNYSFTPLYDADGQVYGVMNTAANVTALILAKQQVEESEQRFQNLIREATVGIIVLRGEEMRVEIVNDAYGKLINRSRQELLGQPLFTLIPETESYYRPIIDGVRTSGEPLYLNETAYFVWVNGMKKEGFLNVVYQPYREADGAITGVTVLCQDVTEQVLARRKVEESEAQFRNLIEEAPVATCLFVGRDLRIAIANQAMIDVWGKGPSVLGLPLAEALPELKEQHFLITLDHLFTTGDTFDMKGGRADLVVNGVLNTYYFDYSFRPLRNAAGEVYAIMEMAVDVTEAVKSRKKIEVAEAALRGAIELAELGAWEFDVATGQVTYSERIKAWFGFAGEAVAVDTVYNPIHEKDRARVEAAIQQAVQPGSSGVYDEEYTLVEQHTGRERIIHAQGKAVFDEQGQAVKLTGTAQDVTKERQLQQELERQVAERTQQLRASVQDLERSNANLQQFAYVASHDLQEPLRKIQSFGDLLKNQYADQLGNGIDHLHRMQSAASRMSILIKDLLTFSRISTRQEDTAPVSLTQVVNFALTDLDLRIGETGAQVAVEPLPTVQGDASQLGQLFQNLLSNALKFCKPDVAPVIRVRSQRVAATDLPPSVRPSRPAAAYQRIDVSDNGIGFDDKYVDRIFQVFQRLHGRNEFAGTGIGLAICEKVVANHSGAITATSRPGEGATFSVYLPI